MKKIFTLFVLASLLISCDKDNYAELNQDPSKVNEPNMYYLFTQGMFRLDDDTYTEWFYDNSKYLLPWTQTTVSGGGNTADGLRDKEHGNRWGAFYSQVMSPLAELRHYVDAKFTGKEQVAYQKLKYATYPIQIMQGLKVTDMYGSLPYTEAMKAKYTTPYFLTPQYENQSQLFDVWIKELNKTIEVLLSDQKFNGVVVDQYNPLQQDFVYAGDWKKWAKLANSLKLRIAVRMYGADPDKARQLVKEVMNNPAGLITENEDNFYYAPGTNYFHFGNDVGMGAGSKNLVDFLKDNRDPRLRFVFNKNQFNSKVVQCFFDNNKALPTYVEASVDYEVVDGRKVFKGWKAPGEPWVRYYGAPTSPDAKAKPEINNDYFNADRYKIKIGDKERTYTPLAYYSAKNVRPDYTITYPDAPGVVVENKDKASYHSILLSAAEVNLYLAELKLLGADVPGNASDYYSKAISQSVLALDRLARDNDMWYYAKKYDAVEQTIELKSGELLSLLGKSAYSLSGNVDEDLEKVYIQQYINFLTNPNEMFVTVRRSGCPKVGSSILAKEPLTEGGVEIVIPRRFTVNTPTKDNINYSNIVNSIKDQGFTAGNSEPATLNMERVWYDKKAPQWGAGVRK